MAGRRSAHVVIGACVMWLSLTIAPHAAAQDPSPPVEQPYFVFFVSLFVFLPRSYAIKPMCPM